MDSSVTIVIITLVLSAFFSATEIAFISSNKLQIELEKKKGTLKGKILSGFVANTSSFIGVTLIGNTIALVVYGIYMEQILTEPIKEFTTLLPFEYFQNGTSETFVLVTQTILSTLLVLVTAEFLPKSIALAIPNLMLSIAAFPMRLAYIILSPIVTVIIWLSKFLITKVFRSEYPEEKMVFGLTDFNQLIQSLKPTSGEKLNVDTKIFNNAIEFKSVKVGECMIPRTEIVAVSIDATVEKLTKVFTNSGHSKILIYEDSIDNILGYCHVHDLFKKPKTISEILTEVMFVPETIPANELMIHFIKEHKSIALVVDEFGGTSGIVTIEDVMEEIFGEIEDEYDDEVLLIERINDNVYLLSARYEIDKLNDLYGWNIPIGDYDTLGGYILSVNQNIPEIGQYVSSDKFSFKICSMEDRRIDNVELTILQEFED